jgi:FK506-binding protein 14
VELVSIDDGQRPPNVFKEIDLDADLQLSQDEVSSYLKKQASNHVDQPEDTDQQTEIIKQIFDQEDKDRNGYISYDEFSGPKHDEL